MTINKFQGKTESEAIEKAKKEMGQDVVIMSVKTVKPKGVFRAFKGIVYEVTAALEENGSDKVNMAPPQEAAAQARKPESINLAADEAIRIPMGAQSRMNETAGRVMQQLQPQGGEAPEYAKPQSGAHAGTFAHAPANTAAIEERLDSLQSLLEDRISAEKKNQEEGMGAANDQAQEGFSFVKMLYQTLLDNEVDEKYANQILDELEKITNKGSNIDYILSHIYQKLVLKFGQPKPIEFANARPTVAFFIGPTGVGKTTTIAKVASRYKVDEGKKVAFLTADTYRIAATEQLRTYANILDMPITIVYSAEEVRDAVNSLSEYDLILVDTAGFSHKNVAQCEDVKQLIGGLSADSKAEVYLVLSATTKYRDLQEMCDIYQTFADYKLIFTKLDETSCYGNLLNIHLYSGADLSYATYGQNVPDDIEVFDTQKIVKKLLGGD